MVFLDGTDIRDLPLRVLRGHIGCVPQDVFLFSDTIRNNVVFGAPDVGEEALWAALEAADIGEEVRGLEKGLDTFVGERGVTLSGGQRQRLTIARALVLNPTILLMDDALSMVDTRTEERILTRILGFRRGQTNIIVSHRVSTLRRADRILVLEGGRVVAEGSHGELLSKGGIYADLYERQRLADALEAGEP
jgi:ATP-binding cassette subfamily B protein